MDSREYWVKKHTKYLSEDWIKKPTIFATEIISYLPKSGKLLELGCGQGQDSKYFAELGYEVLAVDFSQFALDQIKNPRIKTQQSDFNNKRTQELFNEIYEILTPGGVFVGLFNSTDDPETNLGEKIEPDFYLVDGQNKRFMSVDSLRRYSSKFEIVLLDNLGTTHKDNAKGVKNLVRFIGKKSL